MGTFSSELKTRYPAPDYAAVEELFVPLFVLGRSILETGCLVWDVWSRVGRILTVRDKAALAEFDGHLMKVLLGAKSKEWVGDPEMYPSPNVLTIVDRLTRADHPGLRGFYDALPEFAHPNFAGMQAAYRRIDERARETHFVDRPFYEEANGLDIPINAVAAGLGITVFAVELYERDLAAFTRLCEEDIHDGGTWHDEILRRSGWRRLLLIPNVRRTSGGVVVSSLLLRRRTPVQENGCQNADDRRRDASARDKARGRAAVAEIRVEPEEDQESHTEQEQHKGEEVSPNLRGGSFPCFWQ